MHKLKNHPFLKELGYLLSILIISKIFEKFIKVAYSTKNN